MSTDEYDMQCTVQKGQQMSEDVVMGDILNYCMGDKENVKMPRCASFCLGLSLAFLGCHILYSELTHLSSFRDSTVGLTRIAVENKNNSFMQNFSNFELPIAKLRAFVISLPEGRNTGIQDFNSSWQSCWPELDIIPIDAIPHEIQGHGIGLSFISAFQMASFTSTKEDEIFLFFEDDARPFPHINKSVHNYSSAFSNLVTSWPLDSPVLFLGGHNVHYNHIEGPQFPLTNITMIWGMFGIAVRKLWLKKIVNALRHHFASHPYEIKHPDVVVSRMYGSWGHPCVLATPLLIDHVSNRYSDNYKKFRFFFFYSCWQIFGIIVVILDEHYIVSFKFKYSQLFTRVLKEKIGLGR